MVWKYSATFSTDETGPTNPVLPESLCVISKLEQLVCYAQKNAQKSASLVFFIRFFFSIKMKRKSKPEYLVAVQVEQKCCMQLFFSLPIILEMIILTALNCVSIFFSQYQIYNEEDPNMSVLF